MLLLVSRQCMESLRESKVAQMQRNAISNSDRFGNSSATDCSVQEHVLIALGSCCNGSIALPPESLLNYDQIHWSLFI